MTAKLVPMEAPSVCFQYVFPNWKTFCDMTMSRVVNNVSLGKDGGISLGKRSNQGQNTFMASGICMFVYILMASAVKSQAVGGSDGRSCRSSKSA